MLSRLLLKASAFLGLLSAPVIVWSQAPAPPASSTVPPSNAAPSTTTPKKVWTNEDLSGKGGVSVVGDKHNQNYHMSLNAPADPATVARIKKDLERLQAQLDDVNSKLKSYKEFQAGEAVSTGARDMSKGYSRTPVDQQITQLEQKKKQLETQIGDLMDEARKKGIDPGQLR
jgi:peptidoglycan hydrolase CwlO-like protein